MKSIINLLALLFVVNLFSQTNITQAEYFFDTDPGFGSANAVTINAGNTLSLTNYAIVTQNLPEGIHFLYIRCKNANNKWSIPTRKVMYTQPNLNTISPIGAVEYFFDTDPGFGSANAVTLTAGNTLSLTNYDVVAQNLSVGIHFLYIRCKDANNKWSVPSRKVIYTQPNLNSISPIVAAEYFFDLDPGFGSANAVTVTAGNTLSLTNYNVVAQDLAEGIHFLYIRCKDANNIWSVPTRKVLYVYPNLNTVSPIVAAEYYIDNDPGIGLGNAINVTANTIVQPNFTVATNSLSVGNHILYVRVKNQNDLWSVVSKHAFTLNEDLSVNENSFSETLVYPNPTTGVFNIKVSSDETIQKVEILDILGKKVATVTENTTQIDISHLPTGTYILKISNGNNNFFQKIIKN